jgi:hypothetical protein
MNNYDINIMENFGFIIIRCVRNEKVKTYWQMSYDGIRKNYPETPIVIIDDNSNYELINSEFENNLYKTEIIKGEFPGRGELLPYYYFLKRKPFENACIIHDSVFVNKNIDLSFKNYKKLWYFKHTWDEKYKSQIFILIKQLDNKEDLYALYEKQNEWEGCFGAMTLINHDYLTKVDNKYNISKLLSVTTKRSRRMGFERVLSLMLDSMNEDGYTNENDCLFGDIMKYCKFYSTIDHMFRLKNLPFIKIWVGR